MQIVAAVQVRQLVSTEAQGVQVRDASKYEPLKQAEQTAVLEHAEQFAVAIEHLVQLVPN